MQVLGHEKNNSSLLENLWSEAEKIISTILMPFKMVVGRNVETLLN